MIPLADVQTLSVAKTNIFFINNRGLTEGYFSDKVHAILIEEVLYKLRCVRASFYLTSAFKFHAKQAHIKLQCLSVKANL